MRRLISVKCVIWSLCTLASAIAESSELPAHNSCKRAADFRDNEEPTRWIAVCKQVIDENIFGAARNDLENADFCIAEKHTISDRSALGQYQDPKGTRYFSVFGIFGANLVRTQTVDLMQYQGNPSNARIYPVSKKDCISLVKKPLWGRPLKGACDLEDRLYIHGSFFGADFYLDFDKEKMELAFEQVNNEIGFLALPTRYTSVKGLIKCERLNLD